MFLILVLLLQEHYEKIEKSNDYISIENNDYIFVENNLIYFDVIWAKVTSLCYSP